MLTIPQAARRIGRNAETIRRWIRAGRLRSQKVGTQHLVDERELDDLISEDSPTTWPRGWDRMWNGEKMPDWVAIVREDRESH